MIDVVGVLSSRDGCGERLLRLRGAYSIGTGALQVRSGRQHPIGVLVGNRCIAGHLAEPDQAAVVAEHRRDDHVRPEEGPVLADAPSFGLAAAVAGCHVQFGVRHPGRDICIC